MVRSLYYERWIYIFKKKWGSDHQIVHQKSEYSYKKWNGKELFWMVLFILEPSNEKSPKLDNIFLDCGAKNKEEVENLGVHVELCSYI